MKLKYKNWNDISVNTFKRLRDIKTDIHSDIDALEANISLLSILCDCSEDEISGLSTSNFSKLLQQTDFLKSLPKIDIKDKYVINGKKYELFLTMQEMNVAQYIDFQTYFKDKDKYFNELLSVFLIPKGKKYNEGYNITEVINDIGEHLSILDANSIMFFFVISFQSLTKVTLNSLIKRLKKMKNEVEKEKLEKAITELKNVQDLADGVGIIW